MAQLGKIGRLILLRDWLDGFYRTEGKKWVRREKRVNSGGGKQKEQVSKKEQQQEQKRKWTSEKCVREYKKEIFKNTEGKTRVLSMSNGDTVWFWTSDGQLVTGMTHKQKWRQSRASNKRTSLLCLTVSVGECVGGRVHITEFVLHMRV